jgi:hypothetical protein
MEEIYKDIEDFEDLYQVSNIGKIKSLPKTVNGNGRSNSTRFLKERIRKQHINKKGYYGIVLCKDGKMYYGETHRIIAKAFIPNPLNLSQVNHKNGIKSDNRIENLEWCDASYNIKHAVNMGLLPKPIGERNAMAKLSEKQVQEIRQLNGKLMHKEIAELYGVGRSNVTVILNNKSWRSKK